MTGGNGAQRPFSASLRSGGNEVARPERTERPYRRVSGAYDPGCRWNTARQRSHAQPFFQQLLCAAYGARDTAAVSHDLPGVTTVVSAGSVAR